ncbi:MAG: GNAT family N-acetyltransferase [Burkholderiaceae bacterium]
MPVLRLLPADAAEYRAFMLEAYARHPEAYTSSVGERAALPLAWWQARLATGERPLRMVLAERRDGALAGVAGLGFETRARVRHKAELFGMCVAAAHRRAGIGRRLVEAVLTQAGARGGISAVQLTVTETNLGARSLYEHCGFRAWGLEPQAVAVGDGHVAKVHMRCALAPAGSAHAARSDAPTTLVVPMPPQRYAGFLETATASYAQDCVDGGRWSAATAPDLARAEMATLLPNGVLTPDHHILELREGAAPTDPADMAALPADHGTPVGFLWYGSSGPAERRVGFVYNLNVAPAHRRRGHARAALVWLEAVAHEQGLASLGLHVFGHALGPQALYRSLGYTMTGMIMRKALAAPARETPAP